MFEGTIWKNIFEGQHLDGFGRDLLGADICDHQLGRVKTLDPFSVSICILGDLFAEFKGKNHHYTS